MIWPGSERLPLRSRASLRVCAALALGGAALTGLAPAAAQPASPAAKPAPAAAQPAAPAAKPAPAAAPPAAAQPAPPAGAAAPPAGAPAASAPAPQGPLSETLTGEAKAEYEAARILFSDGDFRNAIIKFERAYALSHDPRLLWNIALCQKNLQRYARLLGTVEKLLQDAGPQLSEQDRKDAAALIEATKAYVSRLDLQASEAGATVFVDGEEVGQTPLREPVLLDVGTRKIRVTKKGFEAFEVSQQVPGGGVVAVAATLEKEVHQGRLIVAAPPNAVISIDGRVVGRGSYDGPVPSGGHSLRVTASDMVSHQSEVMIHDNQTRRVQVSLEPAPKKSNVEQWLWIGGGVAVLTGALLVGLGVFASEPPVNGNLSPGSVALSARGGASFAIPFGGGR
ncbi:PEGA domain-containing protein [Sorangium cellulosum]|uniref:PEGA domain-containing protein n=1 Tax=Sorangium cellulosum TaxID=56 RepID=UPI0003FD0924|nr:PEGA domain-containing protein [Sorangium cellulosum]